MESIVLKKPGELIRITKDHHNWIFGPDKNKDNIYQAVPQVTLHGFDEGLVQKLNYGSLEMLIKFSLEELNLPETQVRSYGLS